MNPQGGAAPYDATFLRVSKKRNHVARYPRKCSREEILIYRSTLKGNRGEKKEMEIALGVVVFLVGLFFLIVSSDWLIQSSVKLSVLFRLTPLFIGLVVVAFGTSAPEAGVGIIAAIKNQEAIALGNIVGSNIANVGLILGLCALVFPLRVDRSIFRRELPIMIFASILLYVLSLDSSISRLDGAVFIVCFVIFLFLSYKGAKKSFDAGEIEHFKFNKICQKINSRLMIFTLTALSLCGVVLGAHLMVKGGVTLAKNFGISSWIIGITVFAVGTSLPELVASLAASFKKVPSISVGNIVGSNIFNILFVLGIVSIIRPIILPPSALKFELPAMLFFSFILFTVMRTKYKITRWEGLGMFLGYLIFIAFLLSRG
ncbi:MAG: calcium/sodium antiporter [Candidatus Omnitrophota bacterium]|nr:MAG: calcium/sodium antiporter [Candidatus Omnitrophota bacterium]